MVITTWKLPSSKVYHGLDNALGQCLITNASQRAHSAQLHTDVEIMKFLVLPFLDEILSNLFVYLNILAITIQQVCSNKAFLVWNIWQNLSQTLHKTPCYGLGSHLWRANGSGLYLALTTKFPTWCVERGQCGNSFMKEVCGLPQGWCTTWDKSVKKGNIIWIRVLLYSKIISHKISATRDTWDVWMCPKSFDKSQQVH